MSSSPHLPMSPSPHLPISSSPHRKWWWAGAVVGLIVLVAVWSRPWNTDGVAMDLVSDLPQAIEQRPEPGAFSVANAIQNGVWKKAIYVAQPSRLVYRLEDVPREAWLRVNMGIKEAAWARENHGVLFVVSVKPAGKPLREMTSIVVNPFSNQADRQWQQVQIDLNPWADQALDVYLETRLPHEGADRQNHLALWGAPAIVTK